MIFLPPPSDTVSAGEHRFSGSGGEMTPYSQVVAVANNPEADFPRFAISLDSAKTEPYTSREGLSEDFDWSDRKTLREYTTLEQKTLAGKSSKDESSRYREMKAERDSQVFADRYVSDYAEIERLRILSEKIADIQKYLIRMR